MVDKVLNRRCFLKKMAGTGAALAGLASLRQLRAAARKPLNVLLILADDLGAEDFPLYGNAEYKTPHIDALAAGGTAFKTCWATPICSPSRAEIMTGKYGFRTQWYHNSMRPYDWLAEEGSHLGDSHLLFSEALKRYGYATCLSGKWQLGGTYPTRIFDYGFDEYCIHHEWAAHLPKGIKFDGLVSGPEHIFPGRTSGYWHPCIFENGHIRKTKPDDFGPDIYCDYLIDFMERHKNRPFLAYYPMMFAHIQTDIGGSEKYEHLPVPELNPDGSRTGRKTPAGIRYHIEYIDRLIGRLTAYLDKAGIRENTVIIFTSDNGSRGKATPTEPGCRVPMVCNCPGTVKPGVFSDELVDFSDILPTLLDFAGGELPSGYVIDGRSFAPVLKGDSKAPVRDWIFSFYAYHRMLRDKRWYLDGNGRFFDCGSDRSGQSYKDVTDSDSPEVLAAKQRFEEILRNLPAPPEGGKMRKRYHEDWEIRFSENVRKYQERQEKNAAAPEKNRTKP